MHACARAGTRVCPSRCGQGRGCACRDVRVRGGAGALAGGCRCGVPPPRCPGPVPLPPHGSLPGGHGGRLRVAEPRGRHGGCPPAPVWAPLWGDPVCALRGVPGDPVWPWQWPALVGRRGAGTVGSSLARGARRDGGDGGVPAPPVWGGRGLAALAVAGSSRGPAAMAQRRSTEYVCSCRSSSPSLAAASSSSSCRPWAERLGGCIPPPPGPPWHPRHGTAIPAVPRLSPPCPGCRSSARCCPPSVARPPPTGLTPLPLSCREPPDRRPSPAPLPAEHPGAGPLAPLQPAGGPRHKPLIPRYGPKLIPRHGPRYAPLVPRHGPKLAPRHRPRHGARLDPRHRLLIPRHGPKLVPRHGPRHGARPVVPGHRHRFTSRHGPRGRRHAPGRLQHAQLLRVGCVLGTCQVQNLSHRLWQLMGQSGRQDSSPMNPNSPHSYG